MNAPNAAVPVPDPARALWVAAGPDLARSEAEVLTAARALGPGVSVFHAGRWGAAALPWLRRVRGEVGLRVAVEVERVEDVEACLDHGIDMLGIDLQRASPIDELAAALRGVHLPILVSNPVRGGARSWCAALERLGLGTRVLIGVHRGSGRDLAPDWRVLEELRRSIPSLPVLCDPGRVASRAIEVARHAVAMKAAGLVISTSDELTPAQLDRLLALLGGDVAPKGAALLIEKLRRQVDEVDTRLLGALAARMALVRKIGRHKQVASMGTVQLDRWMTLVERRLALGRQLGLREELVLALFERIHEESVRVQDELVERIP